MLTTMIDAGRLKTVALVMDEVSRHDPPAFERLSPVRARFVVHDTELLEAVGRIYRGFPQMSRPLSPRPKADPWLVALGRVRSLTVVTEEANRPGKIPHACQQLGLQCCTLSQMLAQERFEP